MGQEAVCNVRFNGQVSEGKALLETTELLFRGEFRLKIPFKSIGSLSSEDGDLSVRFNEGTAVFELGKKAADWENRIRNPRGLLDKLGVKAGMSLSVIGVEDSTFSEELTSRGIAPATDDGAKRDLVFYEADEISALEALPQLKQSIGPKGAVWIVSPKGKGARVKDTDVMAAARAAGLVDTKVVSFSDTHTALKLVIPVKDR